MLRELHNYQKGDVIHSWELEQESGHPTGSDAYKLYCLGLKDSIEKQIYRDRQEVVVIVCRRNEIRMMSRFEN